MEDIAQFISTVGFPCLMCLILLHEMQEMNKSHKEETSSIKDALNNNTVVLEKILTTLHIDERSNNE